MNGPFEKYLLHFLLAKMPKCSFHTVKLGDYFICNLYRVSNATEHAMSASSTSGASRSQIRAKVKAISEFVEREAFFDCTDIQSSTGFAAFPYVWNRMRATRKARLYARLELMERFTVARWAREDNLKFLKSTQALQENDSFFSGIQTEITFQEYHRIMPVYADSENINCVILYALTKLGWVFGSAASGSMVDAERGALKELYLNCIGLYRMKVKKVTPVYNYEKAVLSLSEDSALIRNKMASEGETALVVPSLDYDIIPTQFQDNFVVVQCRLADTGTHELLARTDNVLYPFS